jgi:mercuric ion transport protein
MSLPEIGGDKITTEKKNAAAKGFWKRHLDKIGVGGSLFAALCCLGFPALLSILSAIDLGFLINDDILRPLMIVFLLVAILGLALGMRHHGSPWALIAGILSAVMLYAFIYVSFNEVIAGLGIAGLVIASLLNVFLRQRQLKKQPK